MNRLLVLLIVLASEVCVWLLPEPCQPCMPEVILSHPPAVCLQLTSTQVVDMALRIAKSGQTVETPCLEILP